MKKYEMVKELYDILKMMEENPELVDNYPFNKSLDEVIIDIERWLKTDIAKMI